MIQCVPPTLTELPAGFEGGGVQHAARATRLFRQLATEVSGGGWRDGRRGGGREEEREQFTLTGLARL